MLEHLHRVDALRFLRDVKRSLKPGGIVRIVVPDLAAIVGWYRAHRDEPAATRQGASSDLLMDMLLLRPRAGSNGRASTGWLTGAGDLHEHKWMYDAEGLRALFAEAGFRQCRAPRISRERDSCGPSRAGRVGRSRVRRRGRVRRGPEVTAALTTKQRVGQWMFPRLPITRFLFDQLRFEANGFRVRFENRTLPWRRRQLAALRRRRELLLNVGVRAADAGGVRQSRSASCFAAGDCLGLPPIPAGRRTGPPPASAPSSSSSISRPQEELPAFLRDCRRVLKPGGVLRIVVPDAGRYLKAYCAPDLSGFRELRVPDPFPADLPTRMDVVNHIFHQWHEHRWGYDFETLTHRLDGRRLRAHRAHAVPLVAAADPRPGSGRARADSLYVDAVKGGE